jgi:hypothetical protein
MHPPAGRGLQQHPRGSEPAHTHKLRASELRIAPACSRPPGVRFSTAWQKETFPDLAPPATASAAAAVHTESHHPRTRGVIHSPLPAHRLASTFLRTRTRQLRRLGDATIQNCNPPLLRTPTHRRHAYPAHAARSTSPAYADAPSKSRGGLLVTTQLFCVRGRTEFRQVRYC